jgi:putative FmdB family regulatory protein
MPIYEFICEKDEIRLEELRKLGDVNPPNCPKCNETMERLFSFPLVTTKEKQQEQLKKRSREQGKKFFRRYPQYQNMVMSRKFPNER